MIAAILPVNVPRNLGTVSAEVPTLFIPTPKAAGEFAKLTVKRHLAALRLLFEGLLVGRILDVNPAHAGDVSRDEYERVGI